jgi:hypothetical protein
MKDHLKYALDVGLKVSLLTNCSDDTNPS